MDLEQFTLAMLLLGIPRINRGSHMGQVRYRWEIHNFKDMSIYAREMDEYGNMYAGSRYRGNKLSEKRQSFQTILDTVVQYLDHLEILEKII